MGKKHKEMDGKSIKDALRYLDQGCTLRETARRLNKSHSTISDWIKKTQGLGLTWDLANTLSDQEIHKLCLQPKGPKGLEKFPIDLPFFAKLLADRHAFTLDECWRKYQKMAAAQGYPTFGRTSFIGKLSAFIDSNRPVKERIKMAQSWLPGEYIAIDYAGDAIELLSSEGKSRKLKVFVAILPHSQLIFAQVLSDGTTKSWMEGLTDALEYMGGCPRYVICDNDTALVKNTERGNQTLCKPFSDLLEYYGLEAAPARVASPRDKGICEGAVRIIENAFIKRLKVGCIRSYGDARLLCRQAIDQINDQIRKDTGASRRKVFEQNEKPLLGSLRQPRFSSGALLRTVKVRANGCVCIDGHEYSVPWTYIGTTVQVILKPERVLEIYSGSRSTTPLSVFPWYEKGVPHALEAFLHVKPEHRHPNHVDPEQILQAAKEDLRHLGPQTREFTDLWCKKLCHMEKRAYADKLRWFYRQIKDAPLVHLEEGCRMAIGLGLIDPKTVLEYLAAAPQLPPHIGSSSNFKAFLHELENFNNPNHDKNRTIQ